MRIRTIGAAAVALAAAGVGLAVTAPAQAATAIPAHVFAPYFEAYNGDSLSGLSQQSGAKYLTMAFIQTASPGSCTVYWNGDTGLPIAGSSFGSDIAAIRARGGDVIPSFGGYAADNGGTEIADGCTDVNQIAGQFEKVITTYDVTRIDLDVEDNSLTNTAGIDRRNKAIKLVEDWAAANGRTIQFVYTLPTTTAGLADSGLAVLRSAVANNARVDIVNQMTFDYYDNQPHQMANDTKSASNGLHSQLQQLYPSKTSQQLWSMIGVTEMVGIDDFGAAETFTVADAKAVYSWASQQGIAELSFWALQRDNGGCPGTGGSDTCSGISQGTWDFSHIFAPFTSGGGNPGSPTPTKSTSPSSSRSPSASPSPSRSTGQGLANGNFEAGLAPWTGGLCSVVSTPVHGGTKALKAAASSSDNAQCSQTVAVQANRTYTLAAWVQGGYAFLGATTGAGDTSTWTAGGSSWTKLTVTVSTGSSTSIKVWIHGWYGTGTVYADDVTLV
ncbi:carbohydrate binding domain-containing protein [Dactylosporangium vinaceum]|uniref:Carbohydrate binding domain-containing protein n=1 Tax=Dactylosporangium vinaceum TaxID=53362 RepID=A0ABV5MGS4_9ACTN|nr:carbohydrate binding domain-containing protein [Dactylosporangium vinaceum]UAB94979.1 carbohydrate binding domain-containing protein [Dactylosporangium vinaceum]